MHWIHALASWPATLADGPPTLSALPGLQALLAQWTLVHQDTQDSDTLSMPHERAWARAHGLPATDGLIPWANELAAADGAPTLAALDNAPTLASADSARISADPWALLSPTHWRVSTDHVALIDPETLALTPAHSRALWATLAHHLAQDGVATHWGAATRWYVAHAELSRTATASLHRATQRGVEHWQPQGPGAASWRRQQNELQMLLHNHPINDEREAQGLLPINSLWLSGTGPAPSLPLDKEVRIDVQPSLDASRTDASGWRAAWHALDTHAAQLVTNTPGVPGGEANTSFTLAGHRSALTWAPKARGWWQRFGTQRRLAQATAQLSEL